MRL
ncbi:hypothetical protein YPPY94_2992, partial [Yersinia pestis PY-94]|jgi:centrin-3